MDYKKTDSSDLDLLWELHKAYKAEIGEDEPGEREKERTSCVLQPIVMVGRKFKYGIS